MTTSNIKTPRELIISLAIEHNGDWDEIYRSIETKRNITKFYDASSYSFSVLTILDKEYPDSLRRTYRPPFALFYYGDISLLINNKYKKLAVIGSRECSQYGKDITSEIIKGLDDDFLIVSGLARGIDGIAHKTALDNELKTIAVIAGGIDYIYPKENKELYERIKKEGLIISETPFNGQPHPEQFVFRNRLIASICDSVLITEAKEKSGTLTTVGFALDMGKDILCVPNQANSNSSCNRLIKEGAILVENSIDVIEAMER
ncbi:MAG: DNA-processing protein DprA [Bacilli bacterium]